MLVPSLLRTRRRPYPLPQSPFVQAIGVPAISTSWHCPFVRPSTVPALNFAVLGSVLFLLPVENFRRCLRYKTNHGYTPVYPRFPRPYFFLYSFLLNCLIRYLGLLLISHKSTKMTRHFIAQDQRECFLQFFLNWWRVWLHLPAVIVAAVVFQIDEISLHSCCYCSWIHSTCFQVGESIGISSPALLFFSHPARGHVMFLYLQTAVFFIRPLCFSCII